MTNAQTKAEQLCREANLELLELGFGCEIINFKGEKEIIFNDSQLYLSESNQKIIGHPIQLQHWLKLLRKQKTFHYSMSENLIEVWELSNFSGEQEGIADYFIEINLTTGQPATEEDYQAILDIVGV